MLTVQRIEETQMGHHALAAIVLIARLQIEQGSRPNARRFQLGLSSVASGLKVK